MPTTPDLDSLRASIRAHTRAPEAELAPRLIAEADIGQTDRLAARDEAADFVRYARQNASRSGLIDKFLQEYGLTTAEGVTLMRLAEALLRTPDAATADSLIKDKVEAGDWAAHKGRSPFPLVNFSTRALMLTAAWLDDIEPNSPGKRLAKATKDLLDRVGEPVIRAAVAQAMKIMGEHFVLGETIEDALRRGTTYQSKGYTFSFDMLGEAALTEADASRYFDDYANAIRTIAQTAKESDPALNPGISVKLSALHPRYEFTKRARVLKELGDRIHYLAALACEVNIGFNIDAEESARLDISLDLIEQTLRDPKFVNWTGFGVVIQAYQRRAPFVIEWLAALARKERRRVMARLVKGAYWDSEIKRAQVLGLDSYPVFTRKVLTDVSYIACARRLFANSDAIYPQFATHNALTAATVRVMATTDRYELQRLHGMGESLHDRLISAGAKSRIYAPVGGHKELLPYLVRRLLENGANSSFVNQLFDPDLSVDSIVADPVSEAAKLISFPNPNIPEPRDCVLGERLSAEGFDSEDTLHSADLASTARGTLDILATPIVSGRALTGATTPIANPALRNEKIGAVVVADSAAADAACAAASKSPWGSLSREERAGILSRAADMLEERSLYFIRLAIREAGKTIPDAIAEVREAVDFLRYYALEGEKLHGNPHGVCACISPWNFPLAIFLGQVSAALAAGSAVVAKPAEQTPLIAYEAVKLLHEAGVRQDALHFLPGDGAIVGAALVSHPSVSCIVFTGSTETAQFIHRRLVSAGKSDATLIAETGGINAMIVDSTALLEQAVSDAVSSAFQSAGQRCSACRVVCVQEDVADRFNGMLAGAMLELDVGDPKLPGVDIGPVIDREAMSSIEKHCAEMDANAKLIGRAPKEHTAVEGNFVRPVAYEIADLSLLSREVFGPVLHVVRFRATEIDQLLDRINALGYGLTLGLHTRIDDTMHRVAETARVGNIYINRNQIGAVVGVQPFGGEGLSGTGPKAGGPFYLRGMLARKMPDADASLSIEEDTGEGNVELETALRAFQLFGPSDYRADALQHMADVAPREARPMFKSALELFRAHFAETIPLPGPTGEANSLRHRGRGIVLCLGGAAEIERQATLSLAAGNSILAPRDWVAPFTAAAQTAGYSGLIEKAGDDFGQVRASLLRHEAVRAVAFDGPPAARRALRARLAERSGSICPLLNSTDEPWRFAVERTLTINTTAAGGDVRLLSLPD